MSYEFGFQKLQKINNKKTSKKNVDRFAADFLQNKTSNASKKNSLRFILKKKLQKKH